MIKGNEIGIHKDSDKIVKVLAGKYEKTEGPENNHNVEPIYFHIILEKGKEFSCDVPEGHNSFIYLLKGDLLPFTIMFPLKSCNLTSPVTVF